MKAQVFLPPVKRLKQADGPVGQGISSLINLNYPMSQDNEQTEALPSKRWQVMDRELPPHLNPYRNSKWIGTGKAYQAWAKEDAIRNGRFIAKINGTVQTIVEDWGAGGGGSYVTFDALYLEQNDRNTGFMPGAVVAEISPNDPEVQQISESEIQKWIDED